MKNLTKDLPTAKEPTKNIIASHTDNNTTTNIICSLNKKEEELFMIREMLAATSKIVHEGQLIEVSDYSGKQREFLSNRLYNLIYSSETINLKEEQIKGKSEEV